MDRVNPADVPARALSTGARIPAIGLGTFGSDQYPGEAVAAAVIGAAAVGYRHFDCASVYGNEHLIGPALRSVIASGIPREELWITSKVWNDMHGAVRASCEQSLADLQLDYLDLFLVHWPFPNSHPPGCDVHSRNPDARPYIHEEYIRTWRQMEALVDAGLVRHIGTSNMTVPKLKLLLRDARIRPAANEMELHPHFQQPELFRFVVDAGIVPIGYSPIGSPARPERDRTPEDTVDIEDPVIVRIAERLGLHPAAVCIKWAVQRGQVPIPFTTKPEKYLANLKSAVLVGGASRPRSFLGSPGSTLGPPGESPALSPSATAPSGFSPPLTPDDMAAIAGIDRNCRLIKGQVFLWKDNQPWEDLWDLDGVIKQ